MNKYIRLFLLFLFGYVYTQVASAQESPKKGKKDKSDSILNSGQQEKQSLDNLYIDACTKLAQGLTQDALADFKNIVKLDSKHHQSYFKLSEIYYELKNYQESSLAIANALRVNSKNKWYYLHQSKVYKQLGDLKNAALALEEVYKLDPKDSEAIYDLIDIYIRKEEWNNALKTVDYLKTITGNQITALRYRKEIYIRMNKLQEAESVLAEIVALTPLDVQSVIELADLYIRNGKVSSAVKFLENTSSSIKNEPPVLLKFIECYSKLNEKEKIKDLENNLFKNTSISLDYKLQYIYNSKILGSSQITSYKKYIFDSTIFPKKNHKVLVLLGDLYQEEGKKDSSLHYYNQALTADNNNLNLWLLVINNTISNNDYQAAYNFCTQALDIFPNNEQLRYQSAIAAYQIHKYEAAVENINKALMLMPETSPNRAQLYTLLGDAYFNLNEFQQSDQAFQSAIRLEPANATAYNNYAYYLSLRNEKLDSALYYVTKALELKPNDPNYLDTYGWVYYQKGDYANAVKWLEKAYSLQKSSEVAEHLGDAYFKIGNLDKAKQLWQESINLGNASEKIKMKIQNGKL